MEIGAIHEIKIVVTEEVTAAKMRSGSLPVLATPYMIAFMEQAASELCDKYVPEGISTVGTAVNIQHLAATAVGDEVRVIAKVTDFDGRKVEFEVEAYDSAGLIGKGTHTRFTIKIESFMKKATERAAKQ